LAAKRDDGAITAAIVQTSTADFGGVIGEVAVIEGRAFGHSQRFAPFASWNCCTETRYWVAVSTGNAHEVGGHAAAPPKMLQTV
jgi:hypothetical protein